MLAAECKEKMQYLKSYHKLNKAINRKLEEGERWAAKAEKITTTISDMPRGGDGENQRELAIAEMVDCDMEANRLIDQLCDLRKQMELYVLVTGDDDPELLKALEVEK